MYQRVNEQYRPNPYDPAQSFHPGYYQMYNMPYPSEPPPPPFEYYAKPAQPQNWPVFMQQNPNFYPEQQQQSQQPQSNNNILAYFQDQNGQMDFGKMLSTVNQAATAWHQVTPVVQQINSVIKSFR